MHTLSSNLHPADPEFPPLTSTVNRDEPGRSSITLTAWRKSIRAETGVYFCSSVTLPDSISYSHTQQSWRYGPWKMYVAVTPQADRAPLCCCCCWSGRRRRGSRRVMPLTRQIILSGPIWSYLYDWCVFVFIAQIKLKRFCSNVTCSWYKFNRPAAFSSGIINASCNLIYCSVQCYDGTKGPLTSGLSWALWLQERLSGWLICHRKITSPKTGAFFMHQNQIYNGLF